MFMETMTRGSTEALRQRREVLVREHVDAENRHDVDGVVATFHHACYDVVPLGAMSDGAAAVHEFLSGVIGAPTAQPFLRAAATETFNRREHCDDSNC